jgi:hypothetical protein
MSPISRKRTLNVFVEESAPRGNPFAGDERIFWIIRAFSSASNAS